MSGKLPELPPLNLRTSSEEASESSRISISGLVVSVSSGEDATLPLDMVMNPFSIFELRTT